MALIHILVNVLDSLDRSNILHIDMAPIPPDEIWGVADNPLVVDLPFLNLQILASVMMPGASIRVFSNSGLWPKGLGKTLRIAAIDYARSTRVLIAIGSVNHELFDEFKQFRIVSGEFRRHKTVNVPWSVQLGTRVEKDNNVGMRKATLLKLNGVEICSYIL
jgi:hypothetical protein